ETCERSSDSNYFVVALIVATLATPTLAQAQHSTFRSVSPSEAARMVSGQTGHVTITALPSDLSRVRPARRAVHQTGGLRAGAREERERVMRRHCADNERYDRPQAFFCLQRTRVARAFIEHSITLT